MKKLLLSLTILLIGMPTICWGNGACTTAMPFLKMGMGVRASAMGKAFCAVANDDSAVHYNPAGLGQIESGQMSLEYTKWLEDVSYTGVSGVYHGFGGFANMLLTNEIQTTTEAQPQGTGKTFREMDGIFGVSGGISLTNHISVGGTGKVYSQEIGNENAKGFAGDIGFLCKTKQMGLGLVVQNIGTKMRFIDRKFALPTTIRTGLAWTTSWLTISGEIANILPEKKTVACVGLEGWLANVIALRCGYDSEDGHGPTAGFGVRLKNVKIDYAFVSYEKFEAIHRLSVSVKFSSRNVPESLNAVVTERIPEQTRIAPVAEETTQRRDQQLDSDKKAAPQAPCSYDQWLADIKEKEKVRQKQSSVLATATVATMPSIPAALRTGTSSVPTLQPAAGQPTKQVKTITITNDNAPIFSGPGTKYSVITTVPEGVELILVDDSKQWYYQVKLPDGRLGWISYVNCQK